MTHNAILNRVMPIGVHSLQCTEKGIICLGLNCIFLLFPALVNCTFFVFVFHSMDSFRSGQLTNLTGKIKGRGG